MKKAFDNNVSRARPRLRLGALVEAAEAAAAEVNQASAPAEAPAADLKAAVKAKTSRPPRPTAVEAVQRAIAQSAAAQPPLLEESPGAPRTLAPRAQQIVAQATAAVLGTTVDEAAVIAHAESFVENARIPDAAAGPAVRDPSPAHPVEDAPRVRAFAEPPDHAVEVQTPAPERPAPELSEDAATRRERLKERLRAVRENPRPEPLPPSVAEAGVLAVERIGSLQAELAKLRAMNLALTQDLESARRQAEKATEEARLRMEESRRLSREMEGRVKLLQELERELAALEGERDDALLALQDARAQVEAEVKEREGLQQEIARRDAALAESLAEEERLCSELESAREEAATLRRSVDALTSERDTLARQVAELTRERAELLEARKALEAVHRALHKASV
ncbi:MAG: extensin-like protein [Myxococcaceae bacterium]|nr:extensin-like protein [Myxococcaceae bacterium]